MFPVLLREAERPLRRVLPVLPREERPLRRVVYMPPYYARVYHLGIYHPVHPGVHPYTRWSTSVMGVLQHRVP